MEEKNRNWLHFKGAVHSQAFFNNMKFGSYVRVQQIIGLS